MRTGPSLPILLVVVSCASAREDPMVPPGPTGTAVASAPAPSGSSRGDDATLPAWEWEGRSGPPPPADIRLPVGGGTCGLAFAPDGTSTLSCTLPGAGFQRPSPPLEEHGALVFSANTLYVVGFHAIASGARVHAYDTKGKHLWELALRACGPVAHSKYFNAVRARLEGKHLVVFGNEANCRYVELVDLEKGRTLKHRIEPR